MHTVSVDMYEHIPQMGHHNWMLRFGGLTKYVHIQLSVDDITYVPLQNRPGKVVRRSVFDAIVPPKTKTIQFQVDKIPEQELMDLVKIPLCSTKYFVWWWFIGKYIGQLPPTTCVSFVHDALRLMGYPVENRLVPSTLFGELDVLVRHRG